MLCEHCFKGVAEPSHNGQCRDPLTGNLSPQGRTQRRIMRSPRECGALEYAGFFVVPL